MRPVSDGPARAVELDRLSSEWLGCQKCALARTRTQVVVGAGDPDSDLMFVGEAPGYHEDKQGMPFVGQAGKILEGLLESIGLTRSQVYIANVLKCRPPGNRDPQPDEIAACEGHLFAQVELIRPRVICTLGNFATKLLSGQPFGITRVHGRAQPRRIAGVDLVLFPIFHPAAALYTPAMTDTLRGDFAKLPELLSMRPVVSPAAAAPEARAEPEPVAERETEPEYAQLGLF
jgi:DNA polymerase